MTLKEGFDQLQAACERVVSLLKDREPGLGEWNRSVHEAITELDLAVSEFVGPRHKNN